MLAHSITTKCTKYEATSTLEALVAAVYCDLGFDSAKRFVVDFVLRYVDPEYLLVEDNYKEVSRNYKELGGVSFRFRTFT